MAVPTQFADTLDGTNGNDVIDALGGNDTINVSPGQDQIDGGDGNDTLKFTVGTESPYPGIGVPAASGSLTFTLTNNSFTDDRGVISTTFESIEYFTIDYNAAADVVFDASAWAPASFFDFQSQLTLDFGGATAIANLDLTGSDYIDSIIVRGTNIAIDGGGGDDRVTVRTGGATQDIFIATSNGTTTVTQERDGSYGATDVSMINAEDLTVQVRFDNGDAYTIDGSEADINLIFEDGEGNNTFISGSGDDRFTASSLGGGNDSWTTGAGSDIFVLFGNNGVDFLDGMTITDFSIHDRIELDQFAGGNFSNNLTNFVGEAAFSGSAGEVRYVKSGGQTLILIDYDGDTNADATIVLSNGEFDLRIFSNAQSEILVRTDALTSNFEGTDGDDVYPGTPGNDAAAGYGGNDTLSGIGGDDTLYGWEGSDTLDGGDGNDRLGGGPGSDTLIGGNGDDIIETESGTLSETVGAQSFDNGAEVDTVIAGSGNDLIFSGYGDAVDGGAGTDILFINLFGAEAPVNADFRQLANQGSLILGGQTVTGIESVADIRGTVYDDVIGVLFGASDSTVYGGFGNDEIYATIAGGVGFKPEIYGEWGNDLIDARGHMAGGYYSGGIGADTIWSDQSGASRVYGGDADDILHAWGLVDGGEGNDEIHAYRASDALAGAQFVYGDFGDDTITTYNSHANAGGISFIIDGGNGADVITGSDGDEQITGGDGNDTLSGGGGSDLFRGESGNDTIDGGSNIDTAIFGGAATDYTITQVSTGVFEVSGFGDTNTLTNVEYLEIGGETIRLLPGTGVAVNFETADPSVYQPALEGLRDFDGNDLGGDGSWLRIGSADIDGDGDVDQILVNDAIGRFATVGGTEDGLFYFDDHGWAGETRVVGIYIDPLVASGAVVAGSDNDSQRRFQNDLFIENINRVLGADDYDGDGLQEVYFALTDGTAYLHAYMHADGNIQYANYQSEAQVIDYLESHGFGSETYGGWFA